MLQFRNSGQLVAELAIVLVYERRCNGLERWRACSSLFQVRERCIRDVDGVFSVQSRLYQALTVLFTELQSLAEFVNAFVVTAEFDDGMIHVADEPI